MNGIILKSALLVEFSMLISIENIFYIRIVLLSIVHLGRECKITNGQYIITVCMLKKCTM